MAGKKKKNAGGPPASPRSPKVPVSIAATSENQKPAPELAAVSLDKGPAEENVVLAGDPPSANPQDVAVASSPSQKVRRKKVDNGGDVGGLMEQKPLGPAAHELPVRVEEKHAPTEPKVETKQGGDGIPLASSSGERIGTDSKPNASGAPLAEAGAGLNNGASENESMIREVSEASKPEGESAGIEGLENRGGEGNSAAIEEEFGGPASSGEPVEVAPSMQVDLNGYAILAQTVASSQEAGVSEVGSVSLGGASASGDVSETLKDDIRREEGMQNGVQEGGLLVGAQLIETVPLLTHASDAGSDGGADRGVLQSVARVSEALSASLSREDNSEVVTSEGGVGFPAFVMGDAAGGSLGSKFEMAAETGTNESVLQSANQAENVPSLPTALPMQTPSVAPETALTPQTASLPEPPKPEIPQTLAPSPPPAVPQFFSPPRVSLSVASADDDTAFFEQLLEDSDEDEVTSSAMSSLPLGMGALGGAPAVSLQAQGPAAMPSFSTPPRAPDAFPRPQVQVTEHPPAVSPGPIPFGPVSPPEPARFTQHGQTLGQGYGVVGVEHKAEGHGIESVAGPFGLGVQLGQNSIAGKSDESSAIGGPPDTPQNGTTFGIAPPQIAMPPDVQTSPGQNVAPWTFPTPRGEEDVDFFASTTPPGLQSQPEQQSPPPSPLPSFPAVDWQQPSAQPGGHFPGAWPHEFHPPEGVHPDSQLGGQNSNPWPQEPIHSQPFGASFPAQDDDISFFNQETPTGSQAPAFPPPPPFSNGPFPDAQPHHIAPTHLPTRPQETVSIPSFGFPSPNGDEGALFFEQAAATPPASPTPPPPFLSHPPTWSDGTPAPVSAPLTHMPEPIPTSSQGVGELGAGPADHVGGTFATTSDGARGNTDASWIPSDASQSASNPFLAASTPATAPSDAAPGFPNPFVGTLDASTPLSDAAPTSLDNSVSAGQSLTAASDAAAVVATATVATVATAVPSFDFGTVGDEGDVSFFESIGGQAEEGGGFGGHGAYGAAASPGGYGAAGERRGGVLVA